MNTAARMAAAENAADDLEKVLQFAEQERRLRNSPQWKTDMRTAIEAHGEAVDRLYDELYRLLDARASGGDPVHPPKLPPDPAKELKKQIVARLKDALPRLVADIIDDF